MSVQQFVSIKPEMTEYISVVLEKREIETAISALLALDLARAIDHPMITSTLTSLRSQLENKASRAA